MATIRVQIQHGDGAYREGIVDVDLSFRAMTRGAAVEYFEQALKLAEIPEQRAFGGTR